MERVYRRKVEPQPFEFGTKDKKTIQRMWRKFLNRIGLHKNSLESEDVEEPEIRWLDDSISMAWNGIHSGVIAKVVGCHHTNWSMVRHTMLKIDKMRKNRNEDERLVEVITVSKNSISFTYFTKETWKNYQPYLIALETHRVMSKQFPLPDKILNKTNKAVAEEAKIIRAKRREEEKELIEIKHNHSMSNQLLPFIYRGKGLELTAQAYARAEGISSNGARKRLQKLIDSGYVRKSRRGFRGTGNAGKYELTLEGINLTKGYY